MSTRRDRVRNGVAVQSKTDEVTLAVAHAIQATRPAIPHGTETGTKARASCSTRRSQEGEPSANPRREAAHRKPLPALSSAAAPIVACQASRPRLPASAASPAASTVPPRAQSGAGGQHRQQPVAAREASRARGKARLRRVSVVASSGTGVSTHSARGMITSMTMRREATQRLALRELHARHAQFARTLNKSEHTIRWHAMALNDYCRFLEEVQGLPAPRLPSRTSPLRGYATTSCT